MLNIHGNHLQKKKMDLAKIGLGLKAIIFNSDGDAAHVHKLILSNFPALENCDGYTYPSSWS